MNEQITLMTVPQNNAYFTINASFKSHYGEKFRQIRLLDGVTNAQIINSLAL